MGFVFGCKMLEAAAPASGSRSKTLPVRRVGCQEIVDLPTQVVVIAGRSRHERRPFGRRPFDGRLEQRLCSLPSLVGHRRDSRPSSRPSQAFAVRHSRFAVDGETSRRHAASSIVNPPKARSSTILARSD